MQTARQDGKLNKETKSRTSVMRPVGTGMGKKGKRHRHAVLKNVGWGGGFRCSWGGRWVRFVLRVGGGGGFGFFFGGVWGVCFWVGRGCVFLVGVWWVLGGGCLSGGSGPVERRGGCGPLTTAPRFWTEKGDPVYEASREGVLLAPAKGLSKHNESNAYFQKKRNTLDRKKQRRNLEKRGQRLRRAENTPIPFVRQWG